jgi:hypothetical protein
LVIEEEFRGYFLSEPGLEHYKLLSHISLLYNNVNLLDIGTYKGCSALALSYNTTNKIYSFDINAGLVNLKSPVPDNIHFIVDDILNEQYVELIMSSPMIFLDTYHDGPFEHAFLNHLIQNKWTGYLLLDDIYLNDAMKSFWDSIQYEKFDISYIGHHSGTGLVIIK